MKEINNYQELRASCDADILCRWAAQGLDGRSRAFRSTDGRAVAVAGPGLSARDRLAVRGPAQALVPLAREVLREVGPTYRPLGDRELIGALVAALPQLVPASTFGWMYCPGPRTARPVHAAAHWLPDAALPEVAALLAAAFPSSYAKPGVAGVECWAGLRDDRGALVAVAALAWSAPDVGLIAGVAVHPRARGQRLGGEVCALVVAEALSRHGAAGLMVEEWNYPAQRIYRDLGFSYQPVAAAAVSRGRGEPRRGGPGP
jgi:GNAT superfamily N-acetyltransferase